LPNLGKKSKSNNNINKLATHRSEIITSNERLSAMSNSLLVNSIVGRGSELIEDYITEKTFRKGLQDLNFINEEYITKLKLIAMGQLLSSGLLDKISGNSNKVIRKFCMNIERFNLKRQELVMYNFYYLHELFVYLKSTDYFLSPDKE
jgi:hypothetical protein